MKKLFLLILILASNLFGQEWNDPETITSITNTYKTDILANSSGIHILTQTLENAIVYYKLNINSEGDVYVAKTETLETSQIGGYFPNIVGSNDKIYAIYKTVDNNNNDVIRVKYSTDGDSWIWNENLDRLTSDKDCNGVDAVYQDQLGIHTVWGLRDSDPNFKTYYARLNPDYTWVEYKNVTDASEAPYGGNPNVVVSPNRVHVSFNTDNSTDPDGSGDAITRDKYNGDWQTPQTVVKVTPSVSEQSVDERLLVYGDYLYLFYNRKDNGPNDLRYRRRTFSSNTWSDYTEIVTDKLSYYDEDFEITKTTNDSIHIIYKGHVPSVGWSFLYKYYDGTNWSTEPENLDEGYLYVPHIQIGLSSVSNDLFCTWVKQETDPKKMRFRQYDADPLAPQNLTVTTSTNNHPLLSWTKNNEADLDHYNIYKYSFSIQAWQLYGTSNTNSFEDLNEIILSGRNYVDFAWAYYKITAVDLHPYESPFSSQINVLVRGNGLQKYDTETTPSAFSLGQNYPNPFNPSTAISYSIKEDGLITLKVYDVLGKEVATLVNENKPEGNYEVEFNASSLPSGMYIYKIQSGSFTDVKKMLLTK